jgi:hypothetical protein
VYVALAHWLLLVSRQVVWVREACYIPAHVVCGLPLPALVSRPHPESDVQSIVTRAVFPSTHRPLLAMDAEPSCLTQHARDAQTSTLPIE